MKKMCNFAAERGQAPRHVPAIPPLWYVERAGPTPHTV